MTEKNNLELLVERARQGDRAALEELVGGIQDRIYGLALRMLWHPQDAEDATQEILIRVITHLGSFRREAPFEAWVYRVAANTLLTTRKRRTELAAMSFDEFAADLDRGLAEVSDATAPTAEERLLVEEVKLGCTQGMLLCLDREHRLTYILGEILEFDGEQGATILEITPAAFRKRLQRAREAVREFTRRKCGIVNPANPCRCRKRVNRAVELGRVDPGKLYFSAHPVRRRERQQTLDRIREIEELERAAALFRSHPDYAAPESLMVAIRGLLDSGRYDVLR